MPSGSSVALTLTILFASTLTRSTLGFGDALIAMPLLTLVVGIKTTTPLVALVALTIALTISLSSWRQIDVKAVWRLIVSTLVGIPFGLFLLETASETLVKAVLGVLLISFGLYNLIQPRLPKIEHRGLEYVVGFVAGVLGGAYNTNGPPIVIYGTLRRWSPERFRATLQGYFLSSVLIVVGHGVAGLWTGTVLRLYVYALPVALVAIYLGGKLNQSIPRGQFDRFVYVALIIMGFLLF